ncbi:hypothetical protein FB387_004513 [Streptomyces cinereoruber]|nr:hypothetical protein [Streptomyces cinereoruber]NIH63308.1 hypothetical protein [Streptomyces cinereoruber]
MRRPRLPDARLLGAVLSMTFAIIVTARRR